MVGTLWNPNVYPEFISAKLKTIIYPWRPQFYFKTTFVSNGPKYHGTNFPQSRPLVKDCQFGVSPVNYSDSDSDHGSVSMMCLDSLRVAS